MASKLNCYIRLMRLDKPIGIYLLAWPMLWALWIAGQGHPDYLIVIIFLIGAVLMRSAGCVINDYADRKIDAHIARTKTRPLATGEVSPREALILFAVLIFMAALSLLWLNMLTIQLAFVAVGLATLYPFMKRFTHLPQFVLGAAFACSVPMAFAAISNQLPLIAWLLLGATMLWVVAYDTMYAMVDRDDDLKIGVKSTAILFGSHDRLIIGLLQLAMLALLVIVAKMLALGIYAWLGLLCAAGLSLYQQWLIKDRQAQRCFQAFLNNHYLGALIFSGLVLDYALRP
ncbi:MAG: 4-hydroxybenzoate octaprenyltransferase [Mariprofundaceae bacterium]|nr:4-hydroxybenzoate octaprenyltransferase [Mariprofundaceae bacterium]